MNETGDAEQDLELFKQMFVQGKSACVHADRDRSEATMTSVLASEAQSVLDNADISPRSRTESFLSAGEMHRAITAAAPVEQPFIMKIKFSEGVRRMQKPNSGLYQRGFSLAPSLTVRQAIRIIAEGAQLVGGQLERLGLFDHNKKHWIDLKVVLGQYFPEDVRIIQNVELREVQDCPLVFDAESEQAQDEKVEAPPESLLTPPDAFEDRPTTRSLALSNGGSVKKAKVVSLFSRRPGSKKNMIFQTPPPSYGEDLEGLFWLTYNITLPDSHDPEPTTPVPTVLIRYDPVGTRTAGFCRPDEFLSFSQSAYFTVFYMLDGTEDLGMVNTTWLKILANTLHVNVLCLDYTGFGLHEGLPTEEAFVRNAAAGFLFLTTICNIPEKKIILMGKGLGTGVAVSLAEILSREERHYGISDIAWSASKSETPTDTRTDMTSDEDEDMEIDPSAIKSQDDIILEQAFSKKIAGMVLINTILKGYDKTLSCGDTMFDMLKRAPKITCPVMMIHGERCQTVTLASAQRLSTTFKLLFKFVSVPNGTETNMMDCSSNFLDALFLFFEGISDGNYLLNQEVRIALSNGKGPAATIGNWFARRNIGNVLPLFLASGCTDLRSLKKLTVDDILDMGIQNHLFATLLHQSFMQCRTLVDTGEVPKHVCFERRLQDNMVAWRVSVFPPKDRMSDIWITFGEVFNRFLRPSLMQVQPLTTKNTVAENFVSIMTAITNYEQYQRDVFENIWASDSAVGAFSNPVRMGRTNSVMFSEAGRSSLSIPEIETSGTASPMVVDSIRSPCVRRPVRRSTVMLSTDTSVSVSENQTPRLETLPDPIKAEIQPPQPAAPAQTLEVMIPPITTGPLFDFVQDCMPGATMDEVAMQVAILNSEKITGVNTLRSTAHSAKWIGLSRALNPDLADRIHETFANRHMSTPMVPRKSPQLQQSPSSNLASSFNRLNLDSPVNTEKRYKRIHSSSSMEPVSGVMPPPFQLRANKTAMELPIQDVPVPEKKAKVDDTPPGSYTGIKMPSTSGLSMVTPVFFEFFDEIETASKQSEPMVSSVPDEFESPPTPKLIIPEAPLPASPVLPMEPEPEDTSEQPILGLDSSETTTTTTKSRRKHRKTKYRDQERHRDKDDDKERDKDKERHKKKKKHRHHKHQSKHREKKE